jgi:hypothetical protein
MPSARHCLPTIAIIENDLPITKFRAAMVIQHKHPRYTTEKQKLSKKSLACKEKRVTPNIRSTHTSDRRNESDYSTPNKSIVAG